MTTAELNRFYAFLQRPLFPPARVVLLLLLIPLALSFTTPLWRISMEAPQYPNGLVLDVWSFKVEAGNDGQHLQEINTLNHYIGMRSLDDEAMADLDWIPFAFGVLVLLSLRVAAVGNVLALVDVAVLCAFVSSFAFGRFVYKLWWFGHHLSPTAPVKIAPFMPVVLGTKQIANFTTHSMPALGGVLVAVFAVGVAGLLAWHLIDGRRHSQEEEGEAT